MLNISYPCQPSFVMLSNIEARNATIQATLIDTYFLFIFPLLLLLLFLLLFRPFLLLSHTLSPLLRTIFSIPTQFCSNICYLTFYHSVEAYLLPIIYPVITHVSYRVQRYRLQGVSHQMATRFFVVIHFKQSQLSLPYP